MKLRLAPILFVILGSCLLLSACTTVAATSAAIDHASVERTKEGKLSFVWSRTGSFQDTLMPESLSPVCKAH
jgi:hypothetical protein